jgi:hypothetical protein
MMGVAGTVVDIIVDNVRSQGNGSQYNIVEALACIQM